MPGGAGSSVRAVIRRSFRFGLYVGLLVGIIAAVLKVLEGRADRARPVLAGGGAGQPWPRLESDPAVPATPHVSLDPDPDAPEPPSTPIEPAPALAEREPTPEPAPATQPTAKKGTTKRKAPLRSWVEPEGDVCPTSHPVKAKLASKIFHLPGGLSYARTRPDRCYLNAGAAEADGLRPAKR